MKKILSLATVLVLLVCLLAACGSPGSGTDSSSAVSPATGNSADSSAAGASSDAGTATAADTSNPILIGLVYELTGDGAVAGERLRSGALLAAEEINAAGGIMGRAVEIIMEDNMSTNAGTLSAYGILAEQDVVAIMAGNNTATTLAITEAIRESGIPHFFSGTNAAILDGSNARNMFRAVPSDAFTSQREAAFIVETLEASKIGILYDSNSFGIGLRDHLTTNFEDLGVTPELAISYNTNDTDYTGPLLAMRDAGIEVVAACSSTSTDAAIIARQYAELGLAANFKLVGSSQFGTATVYDLAGDAMEGTYAVQNFNPDNNEWAKQFAEDYVAINDYQPDHFSAWTYESVYVLKEAIETAGTTEAEALTDAIYNVQGFECILGTVDVDEYGEMLHSTNMVRVEKGGAYTLLMS